MGPGLAVCKAAKSRVDGVRQVFSVAGFPAAAIAFQILPDSPLSRVRERVRVREVFEIQKSCREAVPLVPSPEVQERDRVRETQFQNRF